MPSYLLRMLSEHSHPSANRQYRESKELLEALWNYLDNKYREALLEEEQSISTEEMFKALGRRQALREFIKILPEPRRGGNGPTKPESGDPGK